jgi:hypothetical protein
MIGAQAGAPFDRVTGGGQTDVDTTNGGAGDTLAFTARNEKGGTTDAAQGNVTYIDREGGTGQGQVVYHGTVECLVVDGTSAFLAGAFEGEGDLAGPFQLAVQDNGEGGDNTDAVTLTQVDTPTCDEDQHDEDAEGALARGNAQVYDYVAP